MTGQLFEEVSAFPPGFTYIPEFLSVEDERELLEYVKTLALHTFIFQGFEAKRRVASFGYDYSFDKRQLSQGKPIPEFFESLITKVAGYLMIHEQEFAELLVTEYPPGSVINWHRDAPPFGIVAGISLATDCTFRLRPHDKSQQGRGKIISVPTRARSMYLLAGLSRSDWEHSILPVRETRFSITLRTLKNPLTS
jgi:alkylated DNA repair dioxygenase AlkB